MDMDQPTEHLMNKTSAIADHKEIFAKIEDGLIKSNQRSTIIGFFSSLGLLAIISGSLMPKKLGGSFEVIKVKKTPTFTDAVMPAFDPYGQQQHPDPNTNGTIAIGGDSPWEIKHKKYNGHGLKFQWSGRSSFFAKRINTTQWIPIPREQYNEVKGTDGFSKYLLVKRQEGDQIGYCVRYIAGRDPIFQMPLMIVKSKIVERNDNVGKTVIICGSLGSAVIAALWFFAAKARNEDKRILRKFFSDLDNPQLQEFKTQLEQAIQADQAKNNSIFPAIVTGSDQSTVVHEEMLAILVAAENEQKPNNNDSSL